MIFGTWNPEKILYQHLTVLSTLNPVYTIQPVVKPVVQPVWQPAVSCKQTSNRLSNRLSNGFDNRFDNRVERTAVRSTGCQTELYNWFDKHSLTTGWMFVYTIQPVVKPVVKWVCDLQHCRGRVCLPPRQCTSTSRSWHSSSVPTCGQPTVVTNTQLITAFGVWCRSVYTKYQSALTTCGLAAGDCWDMGWISVQHGRWCDWSVAKRLEVCIHSDGGHYEYLLWRCLPDIQVATQHNRLFSQLPVPHNTTRSFSETPMFRGKQYTFHRTNRFCISQGSAVTFFGVMGKFTFTVTVRFILRECKYSEVHMNNIVEQELSSSWDGRPWPQ